MMLRDSLNKFIYKVHLEIKAGAKWSLPLRQYKKWNLIFDSRRSLEIWTNQTVLRITIFSFYSKEYPKTKKTWWSWQWHLRRSSKKQSPWLKPWTTWSSVKPMRLLWNTLMSMELLAISFLCQSIYDSLPDGINLKLLGYMDADCAKLRVGCCVMHSLSVQNLCRCILGATIKYWKLLQTLSLLNVKQVTSSTQWLRTWVFLFVKKKVL